MAQRLIVADENMPGASAWFAPLGAVRSVPGRGLDRAALGAAEILLVRSVTRVDRALLEGSRVRFVGTATIGTDHLDLDYLNERGIAWASAPGCNATAVVEYVLSCLCALDGVLERLLAGGRVGIVGLGNVGARLLARLRGLGIDCVGHDPFLDDAGGLPLVGLEEALAADVVCLHTPLTRAGPHPTYHLLNAERLAGLKRGAVLLNAGRGAVVDNTALAACLRRRTDLRAVLDVWEGEPAIDRDLLGQVAIATPHIAGYSWDGKVAGTRMVLEACCRFLGVPVPVLQPLAEAEPGIELPPQLAGAGLLRTAMFGAYDVRADDRNLRAAMAAAGTGSEAAEAFDRLRKNYPVRRELAAFRIGNRAALQAPARALLSALGYVNAGR